MLPFPLGLAMSASRGHTAPTHSPDDGLRDGVDAAAAADVAAPVLQRK